MNSMKKFKVILLFTTLVISGFATQAQTRKKMTVQTTTAPMMTSSYAPMASNEVVALLGLTAGALNVGVDYIKLDSGIDWGGYFFMQSSKDKSSTAIVSQVTALGALLRLTLLDNNKFKVSMSPGFGIAMIKDGSISVIDGKKSDETTFGPSLKMNFSYKVNPKFNLGLEMTEFFNMLNDNVNAYVGPKQYFSFAGNFLF